MIEAAERDGRLQAGRHRGRGDRRQHRPRPGAGGARQGLPRRAGRARQDVDREGAAPEGARRRGAHDPLRRRQGPSRRTTRTSPRGWPREIPGAFFADQFNNPANPLAHETQAPARRSGQQSGHDVDAIVVGVGSAGTLTGLTRYFRRVAARRSASCSPIRSARSSPSTRAAARVGEAGSWAVEGIGEDFIPAIADLSGVRAAYSITDEESFGTARELLRAEGILGGSSTGTLLAAALRYCREQTAPKRVVTLRLRHRHALPVEGLQRPVDARPGPARSGTRFGDLRDLISRRFEEGGVVSVGARRHAAHRLPAHARWPTCRSCRCSTAGSSSA